MGRDLTTILTTNADAKNTVDALAAAVCGAMFTPRRPPAPPHQLRHVKLSPQSCCIKYLKR
jgi:hypothetical protein